MRRLSKLFENYDGPTLGRTPRGNKKPGVNKWKKSNIKYGIEIPSKYSRAVQLDIALGKPLWQDAVRNEIAGLIYHDCFKFKPSSFKPDKSYQRVPLVLIFELKQDLRRKARLVIQGFKVNPRNLMTKASMVKGISVRLLDVIAHCDNLKILCGDIGNAFLQAPTKEKVYTTCNGPEWGEYRGMVAIIQKALYGLTTSAHQWRQYFADFIRSLGFHPVRYDRDVWLRLRDKKDGYDYICTHVDDFKIIARNPGHWMSQIKDKFLVKSAGDPDYYLGNQYRFEEKEGIWTYDCNKYCEEALNRVERLVGTLRYRNTPYPTSDIHPELDDSALLNLKDHRIYQQLIGMATWLCTIGRADICFALASLSRFSASPREYHLELLLHLFGYLKKFKHKRIAIDSSDIDISSIPHSEQL